MESSVMRRYKMVLDYDGTDFHGWQVQKEGRTIQEDIELALSKIFQRKIAITGCGRTDAGVHARNYVAHVDLPELTDIDLVYKLNRMLDDDIAVRDLTPMADDFHARYSASYRQYRYCIHGQKMAVGRRYSWHCPDLAAMDRASIERALDCIREAREFAPFCKTGSDAKTMFCDIHHARWIYHEAEEKVEFEIRANRFLRGMVRLIVGALVLVGRSQLSPEGVEKALNDKEALPKSYSVPAKGLMLERVGYPQLE